MSCVKKSIIAVLALLVVAWSFPAAAQLAATGWPKPGKDMANTSNAGSVPVAAPFALWQVSGVTGVENQGVIIDTEGNIVYKGPYADPTSVVSVNSGGVVWELTNRGSWDWGTVVAAVGGKLYAQNGKWGGGGASELVSYDPATGAENWALSIGVNDSTPTVGPDGVVYCHADSKLYCVQDNGGSYTVLQEVILPSDNGVGPLAIREGSPNMIYISMDSQMVAVEQTGATSWTVKWTQSMGKTWRHPAVGPDGNVYLSHFADYVPSPPDTLIAFDGTDGSILWSVTTQKADGTQGNHFSLCAIDSAGETLYFGGHGGTLLAHNTSDGSLKWSFQAQTAAEISASPSVVEYNGDTYIYVPSRDNRVYCLKDEGTSASVFWSFNAGGSVAGQAAVGPDGTVYFGTINSTVTALLPWNGGLQIVTLSLPSVDPGSAYSETLQAWQGVEPYTWSDDGGLPPGLSLNGSTGEISGTATTSGLYSFTVTVTDSALALASDSKALSILVAPLPPELVGELNDGGVNFAYADSPQVNEGWPPFTFADDGNLPPGLSMNTSTGLISGTATTAGTYTFSVSVTDSWAGGRSDSEEYQIVIKVIPLDIITLSIHNGEPNVVYQSTTFEPMSSAGGPYTWSQPSGAIPPGLVLGQVGDNYILSGTPTTPGNYSFSAQVVNAADTVVYSYTMEINDLSPWEIVADDPSSFPYVDVVGTASTIIFDGPLVMSANFEHRVGLLSTAYANGKLYAIGGNALTLAQGSDWSANRQGHLSIYDPTTDNWDTSYWKDWSVLSPANGYHINGMPTGVSYDTAPMGGTVKPTRPDGVGYCRDQGMAYDRDDDGTDEIYSIGGYPNWGALAAKIYDPDTNDWSLGSAPPGTVNGFRRGALATEGTKAYLTGGAGNGDGKQIVEYDLATDVWTVLTTVAPVVFNRHLAEAVDGVIYLMGGDQDGATFNSSVMKYDIAGDSWTTGLASIPTPFEYATAVVYQGKIVVLGGQTSTTTVTDLIQIYDPAADSWSNAPVTMSVATWGMGVELVGDDLYVTSGDTATGSQIPTIPTNRNYKISIDVVLPPAVQAPEITDVARNGSGNIEITFTDGGQTCKIESSTDAYDYVESNMTWSDEATGLSSGTWEDTSTPGTGEKYYRVVGESTGEKADTVGVMIRSVGVGRNMVSIPFEPYSSLDKIIGDQLTGSSISKFFSDTIEVWDNATSNYLRAWYDTANWKDWVIEANPPTFGYDADVGYWITILAFNPAKNLKQFGRVSPGGRSMLIAMGRNLVGSAFPTSRTLSTSNLATSGFTGSFNKFFSDTLEMWNPGAGNFDRFWFDTGAPAWTEWNGGALRTIDPGNSIWITVLAFNNAFTWIYPVSGGGN